MAKKRCIQCDKELPPSWADSPKVTMDPVCPECALRNLRKKSIRRKRILDTSIRKKPVLRPGSTTVRKNPTPSTRTDIPMDFELDTDDPMLLAAQGKADAESARFREMSEENEEQEKPEGMEEMEEMEEITLEDKEEFEAEKTTQLKKPKPPSSAGPQIKLNF